MTRASKDRAEAAASSVDDAEIAKFERLAAEWWDPHGKFRPLHKFNPLRIAYIKDQLCLYFGRDAKSANALKGLRLLDIGCGGGLLCEPMARLGAEITGVDPSPVNIEVASLHARQSGLTIDYRATTAEDLADVGETFDVVLNMEVVEHVADVEAFIAACAAMVKPGGLMVVATINRTLKALGLAIIGVEYILRWLPRGTHRYDKLVRPDELESALSAGGLQLIDETGVVYNPLTDRWSLSPDLDVNYMVLAERREA
ncbi:MAG TPA: bifunctional 2-polyprenyl-6-hydroxyphenol methylase/3-demethylubiquinol 3-O-methyltransferase UbiG [Afifellaceae bacterium]|nr:bifunctional 2-polyprenyl-6-hydroxyphenol methylase/3-demethylubiquinol 3-O-methyltransferase UbiG [Afifellaceae bacterium]